MSDESEFDVPEDEVVLEDNEPEEVEEEVPDDVEDADDAEGEGDAASGKDEPKSRANSRIRTLNSDKRAALERADKAEREVSELRRQMETVQRSLQTNNVVKDAAAEAELLANMDPVERVAYEADKKINAINARLQQVQFSSVDSTDRAEFVTKYSGDKDVARFFPEVEKTLVIMRAGGHNAPREQVLEWLAGKSWLAQKSKSSGSNPNKQAAQARVNSTQGRSTSARSDASSGRGRGKTPEERLGDIAI